MRYFLTAITLLCFNAFTSAQTTTPPASQTKTIASRASDHVMLQIAGNFLTNLPDSISNFAKGFNRSANVYVMFDKRFKSSPKFSAAFGAGIGTANIYFDDMQLRIGDKSGSLPFIRTDTGSSYKKYKLALAYLEAPIEIRFSAHPETPNRSVKAAIGIKVGTILNAHTKGKELNAAGGGNISTSTIKENNKDYFNTTRIAATARVGYGIFSLFGSYNISGVFKDAVAPDSKLVQIGVTISGL